MVSTIRLKLPVRVVVCFSDEQCAHDDEQFAHDRTECGLGRFALADQPCVGSLEVVAASHGRQGREVEGLTNARVALLAHAGRPSNAGARLVDAGTNPGERSELAGFARLNTKQAFFAQQSYTKLSFVGV